MMENLVLHIPNKIEALHSLHRSLSELGRAWKLNKDVQMNTELVLEEIVSNIIFYAFEDEEEHIIEISIERVDNEMIIRITDDGKPFDITAAESLHDASKPAEEREIGGLGVYFVKTLMDKIAYLRVDGRNILTLYKNIKHKA